MSRLYEKGYIMNPVSKAKSVGLTAEGLKEAERLFEAILKGYYGARVEVPGVE